MCTMLSLVRHGNATSVRDVFLVSLFPTLLWFFIKNSISSCQNWTNHLHRVAPSLNRSGLPVWCLCKASLRLSLISIFDSGTVQDHRPKKRKCFAALSQRPILVFLPPIDAWLYAESSLQCLTILPGKCVQVLCKPLSSSVCLDPTHFLLVGLCGATRIVSHRSRVQTVPCFHLYSNNHRWLPHEVHQCSFSFFLWTSM